MTKLYAILLAFVCTVHAGAQVSSYSFSQSVGSYSTVSGTIVHPDLWNDNVASATIPFTFVFNGTAHTLVSVNTNGYITFGSTVSNRLDYNPISATTPYMSAISAFAGDLSGFGTAGPIESAVLGTAPNRIFVIQWKNAQRYVAGLGATAGDVFNFQIRLHEGGGVPTNQLVQVMYGSCSAVNASDFTHQVGLRGLTNADFNNRASFLSWSATTAGSTNTATCISSASFLPSSGLTFTWAPPPACIAPANQPAALVLSPFSSAQVNGSFTAAATAPSGYLVVRYPSGATPTNPVNGTLYSPGSALGSGTVVKSNAALTFGAAGLSASTAYDFYVYAYNIDCTVAPAYLATGALWGSATTLAQAVPFCALNNSPPNASTGMPITTILNWTNTAGSPTITGYHVYFGTNSALVAAEDLSVRVATGLSTTYIPPQFLAPSTTYYWKIVPFNTLGPATGCFMSSFTTYVPITFTAKASGGSWNSAATWQGGVVPTTGNDVVIADGAVVTIDAPINDLRNLTIGQGSSGVLQWNATVPISLFGNLTINNGANFLPYTNALSGQTVNVGGDFINNGFANLALPSTLLNMNGGQQIGGSANQVLGGSGSFAGNATQGIIRTLSFRNRGTCSIATSRNLVAHNLVHAAGTLNTNGKLTIDNTAQTLGEVLNGQVANVVVNNMGSGYTSAPVVFGAGVFAWTAGTVAATTGRYYVGNRVYLCVAGGTFDAANPPVHTSGIATNGTASLLWLAPLGTLGNPFSTFTTSVGTEYFYGNNLYVATVAGVPDFNNPPVHVAGTVASGNAAFRYVGNAAVASVNYDATSQTVRSLSLVNPGSGYNSTSLNAIFSGGGSNNAAAFAVVMKPAIGSPTSSVQKSGSAIITGGLNINSTQSAPSQSGIGSVAAGFTGTNYTVAPTVGFAGPTGLNLVTAGGSGYTTAPTITVTGGTLVAGTALTTANFTITVNQGRVISVYLNNGTNAVYSVPPTLGFSGGGGTGATLAFPAGCWPAATAIIGTNGQLSNFIVTNAGYGYLATPVVGIGTTSGTALGGTFSASAATLTCAVGLYNLTINTVSPASVSVPNPDDAVIPANRKINALILGNISPASTGSLNLSGNLEIFGPAPLFLNNGVLDLGGNTLLCSWPGFAGLNGTATAYITNGAITLSGRGGGTAGNTLNYPFEATFTAFTGTAATVAEGATITTLTVRNTPAPTGAGAIGTRAYRLITNSGAQYGTAPRVTMNFAAKDSLITDNAGLRISQSAALSGPWTERSASTGIGPIASTGSRTTATVAPGPITTTGDDYFAWTTTFTMPPPLAYTVARTTDNVYQSIAPLAVGGDGTGTLSTVNGDEIAQVGINIASTGFLYQGSPVTAISIHPNGYIALNNVYSTYVSANSWDNSLAAANIGFPSATFDANKRNVIAPFYEDLNKASPVVYYKIAGTKVVVEWFNTTFYTLSGPQLYFQVVLDAADQSITFNYGNIQLYNGSQNIRYSYTCGISGGFISPRAEAGQIMQQQYENTSFFTHENGGTANWGANGLSISPAPRSSIKFTPGAYMPVAPPLATAPTNDDPTGAILRPTLTSFPSNVAWDTLTNTANLFTTRFATNTPLPAPCGGPSNAKDVWFKFVAPDSSVKVRIFGSGGFIPRVAIYDTLLAPLPNCAVGAQGLSVTTTATGLTVGKTYFVRVSHDNTGIQATATATVTNGAVTGLNITPGNNYSIPATAFASYAPQNQGPRISFTGGGGSGAAAAFTTPVATTSVAALSLANISFVGGAGYTSAPTVTIESPDWGITGEFGIIIFSMPVNDECAGAVELTNLNSFNCINGQNAATSSTEGASASPEAAVCGNPDDDLWYKFTATDTLTLIKVQGIGQFDGAFQVFNGGAAPGNCAGKTPMACVDAIGPSFLLDSITLATAIGSTYFVRVYHAGTGTSVGDQFNICATSAKPPCVAAPASPANGGTVCRGAIRLSWPYNNALANYKYNLYLNAGAGPATTLVYTGFDTSFVVNGLLPGSYTWRVEPQNSLGVAIGCTDFSFTVIALPTVSITPSGSATICSTTSLPIALAATNAASPTYQWLNNASPIAGATGTTVLAMASGNYRLVVTDGVTGCRDTSAATAITTIGLVPVGIVPAAPAITCDSVRLTATGSNTSIKITEITLLKTGTGQTVNYPSYTSPFDADFVEISNITSAPVNVGGYTFADYATGSATAAHPYTIPAGTIIPANGVLVLQLGTGTNDPANLYFNTGGTTGSYASSAQVGFVIKDAGGNIMDAVACGGNAGSFVFAAGTGVTSFDWTGTATNVSGFAGVIRTGQFDSNSGSDWVRSGSPNPVQTIGTYNGGYVQVAYTWSPSVGLFTDAALTIPYTNQNSTTVFAKPGSTTVYTLQGIGAGCPNSNSVTVTVLPPGTIEWSGAVNSNWNNAANWKCGTIPTVNSNVIINSGVPNNPVINQNVEIKTLTVRPGASVTVGTGFELKLNGVN